MILQSLNQLYERLAKDPSYGLPTPGYSVQKVTFCIVLHPDGRLHSIEDARETVSEKTNKGVVKTKQVPRQLLVPGEAKPPGAGINPCTLWDNTAYLLGYKKDDEKPERSAECFIATRAQHRSFEAAINEPAFSAVCRFFEAWSPEKTLEWKSQLDDFAATGFGIFRILGQQSYVHETEAFTRWWTEKESAGEGSPVEAMCLVTGAVIPIARLHEPAIKGVNGAAPGGAKLASFEPDSFRSYGKDQSYNSPVSKKVAFQYCNALNALLSGPQSRRHRVTIGDATTVFWTERETVTESLFAKFLGGDAGEPTSDDPVVHARLEAFLNTLRKGGGVQPAGFDDDPDTKFYILGLSGNVTRLSVRFWHVGTIAQMTERLRSHFEALRMKPSRESDPEFPPLWTLLRQTGRESKDIPPLLGGSVMQAILNGTPYPHAFYNAVLNRIRADHEINYLRACAIKAFLVRQSKIQVPMSLDTTRTEPAYLLGRLFAALEKTQEDALPGINATIRDRFYGSASATPGAVFPRLLRGYQNNLSKLDGGQKVNRDRLVQAIHGALTGFPSHLCLEDQGIFAIGYYHQRQDFFTKKEKPATTE